ncbi:dipeptide ABC transporter ATP-binding protein [Sneathiella chungangensis]|uniref:Dipeptide ABC transporter ATP-binding protein n=1 Tax=Sneathiella chungangensis TaxID=1418234 RepID=A0A845MGX0_9PROT|nr:ABC transporter ATP-binding protein [Sneathiella chungangensis]MZR22507.1 dipeptide ABC transporter ATP-binding protein [Sneathiella chungangensis]
MDLLNINNLRIEFPSRHGTVIAVDDVTLTVQPGEVLGVVGESGAGKSTIGNAVIGLLEPPGEMTGGHVLLKSEQIDTLSPEAKRKIRGRRIGMIFQDPLTSLDPLQTIEQQLVETIDLHLKLGEKKSQERAVDLLRQVGIPDPENRIKNYPHQFSGGMRQRVVIALALCAEPEVIIADEPTTALDVSIQAQILELMRRLCKDKKVGMLIITHDMGVIADITDRVAVMYHGKLVEEGTTAKILGNPDHPYTQSLISAVPRPDVRLKRFPMVNYIEAESERPKNIDLSTHWLGRHRDFEAVDGPLLSLKNLVMTFVTRPAFLKRNRVSFNAVDDVSFDIAEGEVFGLVGESGSGKSTVARMICSLYKPAAGEVNFAGTDLTKIKSETERDYFRRQMQMIFQDPFSSLNGRMRVMDIIAEPIRFHKLATSNREVEQIVNDLLDHVGLGARASVRFPHEFSGGQRQRISIARALATRPRFLICDEPTSALDVSIQAQILNLLKDLQEELGLTMLFISHDLPVIRQMCDRVGVMKQGKLVEVSATEDLFERPTAAYTRELLDLMPRLDQLSHEGLEVVER